MEEDEWSALLAGHRARLEAARLLNEILVASCHPVRVRATKGAWVVSTMTGVTVLADTLTAVMASLVRSAPISTDAADEICAAEHSPILKAICSVIGQQPAGVSQQASSADE